MLKDYITARAQLVTFILFILTIYFIEQFLETKKKRYAIGLVIIPIIIANAHTAVFPFYFILYLPYLGEAFMDFMGNEPIMGNKRKIKRLNKMLERTNEADKVEEIKVKIQKLEERNIRIAEKRQQNKENPYRIKVTKQKNIKYLIIIMIICLFTGLLTPIGDTPYTYLIKTMQGDTTQNISEHLPLTLVNNMNFMCVLVLFLGILIFTDTKIRASDLFMLLGLTVLTFYTRRQESMFVIMCGFILNRLITQMFNKYDKEAPRRIEAKMTELIGMITTITLVLIISVIQYKPKINDEFVSEASYPVMAADYIVRHLDLENIRLYNEYNYGSYLLFRGIPVFIDSRADLYTPEFNEGVYVFKDFLDISGVNISNIEEGFNKYGFTHLIMNKDATLKKFIDQTPEKYEKLYEDDYFCVYERKSAVKTDTQGQEAIVY